jgi:MtN3 and saliva related transmembrane protein
MSPTLLGLCAGTLTTVSFVPQVVKSWRRRSAADLSLAMLLAFTGGVVCWIGYGIATDAWPIIAANAVTLLLALALIAMKIVFR